VNWAEQVPQRCPYPLPKGTQSCPGSTKKQRRRPGRRLLSLHLPPGDFAFQQGYHRHWRSSSCDFKETVQVDLFSIKGRLLFPQSGQVCRIVLLQSG